MITTNTFNEAYNAALGHDPKTCEWCKSVGLDRVEIRTGVDGSPATTFPQSPLARAFNQAVNDIIKEVKEQEAKRKAAVAADNDKAAKKRVRDRDMVTRALVAVEAALATLPKDASGIAGYLQALWQKGGTASDDSALAGWLTYKAVDGAGVSGGYVEAKRVKVTADPDAIIIDLDPFAIVIETPAHVATFINHNRDGMYPDLVKATK
jgi:hypothetical protein